MRTGREAGTVPMPRMTRTSRVARELRAMLELWLLPLAIALVPYRLGLALARAAARRLPLYAEATDAAAAQWREVERGGDESVWRASYRLELLVDHADLFWSLTRSRGFLLRRLRLPALALARERPLVVVSYHYGQGLWLLHWLATLGHPPRFVTLRIDRDATKSVLAYAYARVRNRQVARLAGVPPIFTGGARRAVAETLATGGTVYGLIDVPVADAPRIANCALFGRPARLPTGLLDAAVAAGAATLVLSGRLQADGSRLVEARADDTLAIATVAHELELRVRRAPAAWHFWHLWTAFEAVPHA